jgi:hypothetical protein
VEQRQDASRSRPPVGGRHALLLGRPRSATHSPARETSLELRAPLGRAVLGGIRWRLVETFV